MGNSPRNTYNMNHDRWAELHNCCVSYSTVGVLFLIICAVFFAHSLLSRYNLVVINMNMLRRILVTILQNEEGSLFKLIQQLKQMSNSYYNTFDRCLCVSRFEPANLND